MRVSSNRRPRGGRVNSGNNRTGGNTARSGQNNNRRSNAGNRNYDSNGPDGKIRGTANQVYDKYVALATDAHTSGDHVSAENYFQHAEHYFRIIAANNLVQKERQPSEQATLPSDDEGVSQQVETKENPKQEKISKERREEDNSDEAIVLDLSKTDQPAIDLPDADAGGEVTASSEEEEKPKRKVSRTRTLRRRTSSRATSEDDAEEVNTTE